VDNFCYRPLGAIRLRPLRNGKSYFSGKELK
jgi:hypothetical protein